MRTGGTAGARPASSSNFPSGARKERARPESSCQPLPGSKPSAPKRLASLSSAAAEATGVTNVIPLTIDSIVSSEMVPLQVEEIAMAYETLQLTVEGAVATVTLNRPKVLNALNAMMLRELEEAFAALADDTDVLAILITGSGGKAFAAG